MEMPVGKVVITIFVVIVAIPIFFLLVNPSAFLQKPNEVVVRANGDLRLGKPQPAAGEARDDLPFARLSEAAYQKALQANEWQQGPCSNAEAALCRDGWTHWPAFLTQDQQTAFTKHNLRIQVWENP